VATGSKQWQRLQECLSLLAADSTLRALPSSSASALDSSGQAESSGAISSANVHVPESLEPLQLNPAIYSKTGVEELEQPQQVRCKCCGALRLAKWGTRRKDGTVRVIVPENGHVDPACPGKNGPRLGRVFQSVDPSARTIVDNIQFFDHCPHDKLKRECHLCTPAYFCTEHGKTVRRRRCPTCIERGLVRKRKREER